MPNFVFIEKFFLKLALWILIVATVPVATIAHQLILFGIYFSMYNVKHG